ncbi:MAG: hypothetical protein EBS86_15595 [Crocinitomicaceae bacterium]|nr:hypothetical protein [Crocinitomicaceae bacterium]
MKRFQLALLFISFCTISKAQIITREDSLNAGLVASNSPTVISGYGNFKYQNNLTLGESVANVDRIVLFFGHKFSNKVSFFSEMELEDARVEGGKASGEFSIEQAFLKFNIDRNNYISTGLFIPRIGIINENHLPTTYNGNERPFVETLIIPSTWRELGVSYYGTSKRIAGLNYSLALVNGLSSTGFTNGTGIRDGRFEGGKASASALATTGALLYYVGNFRMQVSAYYGGSAGINARSADSLQLNSGIFGTPVFLSEANVQYNGKRFHAKGLATMINIQAAEKINRAYANNTPKQLFGSYLEASYDIMRKDRRFLSVFSRYEYLDMNQKLPENGIYNGTNKQQYVVSGLTFSPVQGAIIKLDYTYRLTGGRNPELIVLPFPQAIPYYTNQHLITLGIGYSF